MDKSAHFIVTREGVFEVGVALQKELPRISIHHYKVDTFTCYTCKNEYAVGMDIGDLRDFGGVVIKQCVYCWNVKHPHHRLSVWSHMQDVLAQSRGIEW